ncbi:hypothetical protein N7362_12205 [Aeromonas caviae]|uniref:hypothetical protein n=1 Tax=Aeromonas caviae TaxID=648 RepID=UPI00244806CF|nr:hypothetical protein [Aeromonas caviae]MDH0475544.1 hypothetical protein [Aeromonas caviae]
MSNKVSITDLLTAVGSDNIRFQDVMSSMENIKSSKGTTIISFATDAMSPGDAVTGSGPKGLVLWIDQSLMQQRLNELKEGEGLTYGRLLEQRDELLEALEVLVGDISDRFDMDSPSTNPGMKDAVSDALAAIAKVKGGAA